jgi:hypothetical protein
MTFDVKRKYEGGMKTMKGDLARRLSWPRVSLIIE